ncbi:MAG: alpha/beta hydrolase [Chitinophagaceae bacterium]|nr:MAG: alpha/beta hydrolase [Chitinophagaceae bacterium]
MRLSLLIYCSLAVFFGVASKPAGAQAPGASRNVRPFVLGRIDSIRSVALGETRILNIYIPEGYNALDTVRYPVVYLLDGSADEDFIHISGLYQYYSFPWIRRVPPTIVVGIASVDRRRDFTYPTQIAKDKQRFPTTGGSARFIRFIEEELQPFIQQKFKTNTSRTLIGQSLGGLLATEILFSKPALFNRYIIVSPSLWWDNGSLLERKPELLSADFKEPLEVYVGVGKEGLVPGDHPRVMEVDANLLADLLRQSASKTVRVHFDYLPEEDHATIMHPAVMHALRFFWMAGSGISN